jgi:hypothetical protein
VEAQGSFNIYSILVTALLMNSYSYYRVRNSGKWSAEMPCIQTQSYLRSPAQIIYDDDFAVIVAGDEY